jgi:spermidine/putrescine transport system substrate-binding protein
MTRYADTRAAYSRRDFIRRATALGLIGPGVLAACGGSDDEEGTTTAGSAAAPGTAGSVAAPSGDASKVRVASWPFYIENDQDPKSAPTIKTLIDAGVDVNYQTVFDDNIGFTEKFRPDLVKGADIGYDICVPTSWMAAQWIEQGWCQEIPADMVPNKVNLRDDLANPSFDPGRKFSLPFAQGQAAIAYYPDKVGFEIKTFDDFLRPELKGRITILSELRDTVGMFLLWKGKDPASASLEEILAAIEDVKKLRDEGMFKEVAGNYYAEDLSLGDTWASLAWSGDVSAIQAENPDLQWVIPPTGAMLFTDTMVIPKGGNAAGAATWMNHLYDPKVSAPLFEFIGYVSPVKGASELMSADAAANGYINPPPGTKIVEFRTLTADEIEQVDEAFTAATQQ